MKPMIPLAAVIAAIAMLSVPSHAGPFGFQKGETKDQAINRLGKAVVSNVSPDPGGGSIVIFATAPTPVQDFTTYSVDFGKNQGALKIVAATNPIPADATASVLYDRFEELKAILTKKYGPPSNLNEPEPTNGITKDLEDRSKILSCYWAANPDASFNGDVTSVMLKAVATDDKTAVLVVSYELTGFLDYQRQAKAEKF